MSRKGWFVISTPGVNAGWTLWWPAPCAAASFRFNWIEIMTRQAIARKKKRNARRAGIRVYNHRQL